MGVSQWKAGVRHRMKNFFYNIGYFFKEAKTIFKVDLLSNIFSIFSIGLIFFILSMIFSGWWISNQVVDVLQREAEINVYYDDIGEENIDRLIKDVKKVKGVREVLKINEEESYNRMVDILGKEARMLELFDDNPFSSFIEVKIDIDQVDNILEDLNSIENIEHIRDNKQIIGRIKNIVLILKILGVIVVTAVGISTLVVISHIIRQGIYNNREQINTLKLLGAPQSFIGFPFVLNGVFLTMGGGILASALVGAMLYFGLEKVMGMIPFLPIPDLTQLITSMFILIISLSIVLGVIGSLFGVNTAKVD